ncbi:hypothetical protein KZ483_23845 [Paenibacillus sp. sptzw28]|uniref:hypothetical protein n=1 Tax=Paenibacillus sp. sptzw28 TaxID=715179 RepID=UPI001C6F378D|nr:hypothetical protein [Paenibacillus sp. sptzw28]QYR20757.1 hypothetical protein KZ483_23845 [Paenibacillus sp. sptzw28]
MRQTVGLIRKVEALKRLETYGYQASYYILQDEELAAEATKTALLELSKDDAFFDKSLTVQRDIMRKTIIHTSITIKQQAFYLDSQTIRPLRSGS